MSPALPSYGEAASLVAARAAEILDRKPRTEGIDLSAAAGRVVAQPIRADQDMPSFPRSTRDGFACRAAEASTHSWLSIAGSIRAGEPPAGPLPPGAAWEIMTGAPVPEGADAVAMLEHVEHLESGERLGGKIRLMAPRSLDRGENVVPEGAEARAGNVIVPTGTRLNAAHIAAAATCGYATLEVYARPSVAILTTGDELVPVDQSPAPGQIRNSNAPMLAALVSQAGGEPWILPAARDSEDVIVSALGQALRAEMILVSGGVSAGKFDLVEPALALFGAKVHFTGVRIQPGKPVVFCEISREEGATPVPVLGLPGNPISSAATFLLFAAPILAALCGSNERRPDFLTARLVRRLEGKPGLTRFVPSSRDCGPIRGIASEVEAVNWKGSGDLAAFALANCFAEVPEGVDHLNEGEFVRILPL